MTTVQLCLEQAIHQLETAGCETPRLDAQVLLAEALGQTRTWLYTHPETMVEPILAEQFAQFIARRVQREPVAYITGHREFFGLDFIVNPHVLIPRPETELLVEAVMGYQSSVISHQPLSNPNPQSLISNFQSPISIADIGTGSGCIAIALAKHLPAANLWAVDCSLTALEVARQNAERHGVAERINFVEGDLLEPLSGLYDVIVSNPPYVSQAALQTTAPEVQQYEPWSALIGGADGLVIICRLLEQARNKLKPHGRVLIEIGADQGEAVQRLAKENFPTSTICLKQDLAGLDRILIIEQ